MLKNKFFKYTLIKYKRSTSCLCSLYSCVLLSALSILSAPVVHASPRCADLVPTSSKEQSKEQSVSMSKEHSAPTDFGSSSSGKNVLPPLSSSTRNGLGASLARDTLGSSSTGDALDFYSNFFDFSDSKNPRELTKNFQSYIGELLEEQIIGEPQLIRFIENLEEGKLINPISEDEALTSTSLLVQRRGLQEYLDKPSLDQKELLDWSRAALEKRAQVRVRREETQQETRDPYQKLEFHPVKRPAHFKVVGGGKSERRLMAPTYPIEVALTYPIEVQSTPVTQKQWVEVMGENSSHFAKGEDSVVLNFHGKPIRLRPDHPVESVTWWSVLVFANRLSEKHGLPPAYDLSDITWDPDTRPENGTLRPMREGNKGEKIRVYAKGEKHDPYEGDIYYQAEGYRLPTTAEQDYMLRGGGEAQGDSFFKNEADLEKHAWYKNNANGRTHPVGVLQAITIDGKKFHDLYGNVNEWGWDWGWYNPRKFGRQIRYGKNSVSPKIYSASERQFSGGGWTETLDGFEFTIVSSLIDTYYPYHDVGFRLVRTIDPGDGE